MKKYKYNENSLQYEEYKENWLKSPIIPIGILLFIVSILIGFQLCWSFVNKGSIIKNHKLIIRIESIDFSEEHLIELIKNTNIKYPYIVLAQFRLESNNYTSRIFKENRNLGGLKHPKYRLTTSLGTQNGHAYYKDWVDCVYDYAMYQSSLDESINTEEAYYKMLHERYAEDPNYISLIKDIVNKQKLKQYFYE